MKSIRTEYRWSLNVCDRCSYKRVHGGFKSRLAWAFRALADFLDGGKSVRVFMESNPILSQSEKNLIFNAGMKAARKLFVELVEQEAIEAGMKEAMPELYEGGDA